MTAPWWQSAVVYQIYPRSFQDTNHDGIGDIQGIISHLDYLQKLGVDAIWLSPVYASPNDDNGYDISDYESIMSEFGTMADMDALIHAARERNIKIVMDLVLNHTSDEHAWFIASKQSRDNAYRDFYIWRDAHQQAEPNDLHAAFGGSAWTLDPLTNQYYLHLFSPKQPDLNWANPDVRQTLYQMINFWIDKGVGGFRLDVIDLIGKIPDEKITANGAKLHDYLKEMNQATFAHHDLMTVGETWGATPEIAKLYTRPDRQELSMVFQFEHITLDQETGQDKWFYTPLDVSKLKVVMTKWQTQLNNDEGWQSLFWNNHDLPRIVSRWGNDTTYRVASAKMLAILLHMMKGTPYIYQGEEIGLTNTPVKDISALRDIESLNYYHDARKDGNLSDDAILDQINHKGRDNARRPIPWRNSPNGGFSDVDPWLAVNSHYPEINVEAALNDPNSVFYTYQKLITLRHQNDIVVYGDFELIDTVDQVFAYYRHYHDRTWLVVTNFSQQTNTFTSTDHIEDVIIANYDAPTTLQHKTLQPYEAFVVKVTTNVSF